MEKHFDIGVKITKKRRAYGNITNNKQIVKGVLLTNQYFSMSLAHQLQGAFWERSWLL